MLDPHHVNILAVYQTVIQKEENHRKALVILLGVNKVQELRSRIVGIPTHPPFMPGKEVDVNNSQARPIDLFVSDQLQSS
jgi:hypothetical protein